MTTELVAVSASTGGAAGRKAWTRGERAAIALVKDKAVDALAQAGFTFVRSAFPFALHHRVVVRRVRQGFAGRDHLRTSEVSDLLDIWANENGGAEIYAWQAIALAAEALSERQVRPLPGELDDAIDRLLVDRGLGFVRYVRRAVASEQLPSFVAGTYAGVVPSEVVVP